MSYEAYLINYVAEESAVVLGFKSVKAADEYAVDNPVEDGRSFVVAMDDDLRVEASLSALSDIYRLINDGVGPKKFDSKAIGAQRVFEMLPSVAKEARKGEKRASIQAKASKDRIVKRTKGETYQDKIREVFATRKRVSRDELTELIGAKDAHNCSVAVSILRNPERSGDKTMNVRYDRKSGEFYLDE